MANVSKKEIKEALSKKMKSNEDRISIFGLKTKFGGGRTSGFALIYNSVEDKTKFDPETLLRRVSFRAAEQAQHTQGDCLIHVLKGRVYLSVFFLNSTQFITIFDFSGWHQSKAQGW